MIVSSIQYLISTLYRIPQDEEVTGQFFYFAFVYKKYLNKKPTKKIGGSNMLIKNYARKKIKELIIVSECSQLEG